MEAVFAYGTLKRGERNHPLVEGRVVKALPGYVEGFRLYHLAEGPSRPYPYPGMVPGEGRVYGEVLFLPEEVLSLLDRLEEEGEEYRRVRVLVETEEGPLLAWTYLYLGDLEEALPLPQGTWRGGGGYPVPTPIYHLTHVDNLKSILAKGGLLPKVQAPPTVQSVAYPRIQARRAGIMVPLPPGGTLHDYVPFYFCPRSPMLYALAYPKPEEMPYQGGQRPILHLVSSVQRVEAAGLRFVFTDRHAVVWYTTFLRKLDDLRLLDWEAIGARKWVNTEEHPDRREKKQAEFLVYGRFPWKLVEEIAVMDPEMAGRVREILQTVPHVPHPPVRVRREWYY